MSDLGSRDGRGHPLALGHDRNSHLPGGPSVDWAPGTSATAHSSLPAAPRSSSGQDTLVPSLCSGSDLTPVFPAAEFAANEGLLPPGLALAGPGTSGRTEARQPGYSHFCQTRNLERACPPHRQPKSLRGRPRGGQDPRTGPWGVEFSGERVREASLSTN